MLVLIPGCYASLLRTDIASIPSFLLIIILASQGFMKVAIVGNQQSWCSTLLVIEQILGGYAAIGVMDRIVPCTTRLDHCDSVLMYSVDTPLTSPALPDFRQTFLFTHQTNKIPCPTTVHLVYVVPQLILSYFLFVAV